MVLEDCCEDVQNCLLLINWLSISLLFPFHCNCFNQTAFSCISQGEAEEDETFYQGCTFSYLVSMPIATWFIKIIDYQKFFAFQRSRIPLKHACVVKDGVDKNDDNESGEDDVCAICDNGGRLLMYVTFPSVWHYCATDIDLHLSVSCDLRYLCCHKWRRVRTA